MFCPNCGSQNQDQSKFCRRCGTNLAVVTSALAGNVSDHQDDLVALQRRVEEEVLKDTLIRRRRLLTAGTIVSCVGFGIMIMLSVLEGKEGVVGLIPLMVGIGLILSALLIYKPNLPWQAQSKKTIEAAPQVGAHTQTLSSHYDRAPDSVTSETTRRLEDLPPPRRAAE